MSVERIILALVLILALSLIAQPVSRWLRLPLPSVLVALGFLVTELIVSSGIDTGIRADNFQSVVFYVFIPVLVFESAYNMDKPTLKKNIFIVLSLAIIAMLLTCVIASIVLFYGIAHETGFPWLAALLTGSILASTDPVAAIEKLKMIQAPERISVLLEGESLFNDATAIVLFSLFLSMALAWQSMMSQPTSVGTMFSASGVVLEFLFVFFGGALIGLLVGVLFGFLEKRANQLLLTGVMSLVVAYGSFMLAEYFSVSGVMATLSAAISFSVISQSDKESPARSHTDENKYFWQLLSHVANVCMFLLMGAVITVEMFEQRWLAMLIAVVAILFARAISIYGVLAFFSLFKSQRLSLSAQTVMVWGGLRGAVTLALALSLPTTLDYWWTIQSIAFGVVLFSLFVQAPTMALLAKKILR